MSNIFNKKLIQQEQELGDKLLTREYVLSNPDVLFLFTDNTNRTSGSNKIDPNSWYSKKYGNNLCYPNITQAVIRGLDNAYPISTQRYYIKGVPIYKNRWNDSDFEEFKKVIDDEFLDIRNAWYSLKYKRIVLPSFAGKISQLNRERTPKLWDYLVLKLNELYKQLEE